LLLILVSVTLALINGGMIIADARNLLEIPEIPKPELPVLPKPELPEIPKLTINIASTHNQISITSMYTRASLRDD
ncbi:hypothetical protein Tco_0602918, partial [Tanacetum coccineum]